MIASPSVGSPIDGLYVVRPNLDANGVRASFQIELRFLLAYRFCRQYINSIVDRDWKVKLTGQRELVARLARPIVQQQV